MTHNFPEPWELLDFFESEHLPSSSDEEPPWGYGRLEYRANTDEGQFRCIIWPTYGEFVLEWMQNGTLRFYFDARKIASFKVEKRGGIDRLIVDFQETADLERFVFSLKPVFSTHFVWRAKA